MPPAKSTSKKRDRESSGKTQVPGLYDDLQEHQFKHSKPEAVDAESAFQEFLYDSNAIQDYEIFFKMFNMDFDLQAILGHHVDYLEDQLEEFTKLTAAREIEYEGVLYVHAIDLVQDRTSATARLNKKYISMPEHTKFCIPKCPKCRHRCRLFQRDAAFVVFLFLIAGNEDQHEDKENSEEEETAEGPSAEPPECDDIEEDLDAEAEREIAKELNLTLIRSRSTVIDIPASSRCEGSLPLPLLPTFPLNDGEYILVSDIQRSLGLREDEALAILAQSWNFNVGTTKEPVKYKDYLEPDPVLGMLDICFDQPKALQICFGEAENCREPTQEEFLQARERLDQSQFSEPDRDEAETTHTEGPETDQAETTHTEGPVIEEPQIGKNVVGSINLWRENLLVADETLTVTPTKDDFLKRAGGSRVTNLTKDAALKYYIGQLANHNLIIFHLKFSLNGYMPVFTLKTLSRYLGSYFVHSSAAKVLLLEKHTAIQIFGYDHAMQGSLAGSYLTYTGLALSVGVNDPSKLTDHGKRHLLRHSALEEVKDDKNVLAITNQEDLL